MESKIIAVCGKGGVGKTFLTAAMVKLLADREDTKILAIDADPSFGLAPALGIKVKKTVNDIRNDLIDTIKKGKRTGDKSELLSRLDYEVFDALEESANLAVLAIGRPEDEGCYCQVNQLLKEIIETLSSNFDLVLIDGEAGVEQINRRVMKTVDDLVLITDTSAKGVNVVSSIKELVETTRAVECRRVGLVINRVENRKEVDRILGDVSVDLLGWIPEDDMVREYDFNNRPITDFPDTLPSIVAVRQIVTKLAAY
jgi:CO dehydrogenase maturation factor